MNLLYDGRFEGLILAIEEALKIKDSHITISKNETLDENLYIESRVPDMSFLNNETLEKIKILYLSEVERFENIALGIVKGDPNSYKLFYEIRSRFFHSIRKFKAFLRFRRISDDLYYAVFEPEFNIIEFVGNYFYKKMDFDFIIYDKKREISFIRKGNDVYLEKIKITLDTDDGIDSLWKVFFNSISIQSRKNTKIQNQKVPLKYRKYMTEFLP